MVKTALASRWMLAIVALLAFALTLPSISNGIEIDDHLYRARVREGWSASRSAQHLFEFADPDRPDDVRDAMASGELSWWAAPHLRWRYLRPLAALTHHAEFRAFDSGGEAWMHLHSVLWMAALALVVAMLYRRMFGAGWIAGLAALLYAINDGHGFTVGWIANRCSLMAAALGIAALLAHDRWRRDGWRPGAVLGPLAFAATLSSSEEGIAVVGLYAAYAIVLDRGRRFAALAPYAGVGIAWYAMYRGLGYGVDGTGSYTDPFAHPIVYVIQALQRIPILIHSELGALPADLWEVYFVRQGLAWVMVAAGVVFLAIAVHAFARLVRSDRVARFWALGFVLSLGFVCGPHPTDRHLLVVGVAGSALVARFLAAWAERRQHGELVPARGATAIAVAFLAIHLVIAPILLPVRARLPGALSRGLAQIDTLVPDDAALAQQDLVLVNVPFKYLCNFASVVRRSNGGVSPRRWRCLGVSDGAVSVWRIDPTTLVLRPAGGYLRYFEDTNVRSRQVPFAVGDRVELPDVTITIRQVTADHRPAEVAYRFAVPLEDASLRWLVWRDGAYRPFVPPPLAGAIELPADHFAFGDLLERR